jgi:hypothetical protein
MSNSFEKPMIQITIIFVTLVLLSTPISSSVQDGECYSAEVLDVFRTSSGGYDASMSMNGTTCSLLCQEFDFPLAGVVSNKYCLCGMTDDWDSREAANIGKKLDPKECHAESSNVKIFKTSATPNQVIATKITPNSLKSFVDETVSFEVGVLDPSAAKMLDDLELSLDCGDGSPIIRVTSENKKKVEHIYRVPGKYLVKLHAKTTEKNLLVSGASILISIGQKFDDSEIAFDCLSLVEPGDNIGCNISAFGGQDLTVEINYGDGSDPFIFNTSGELTSIERIQWIQFSRCFVYFP